MVTATSNNYIAVATSVGAWVPNPSTVGQVSGDAFFQWACNDATKNGVQLSDPDTQAQVNTSTLYLNSPMKFLEATPGGETVVAASAQMFQDLGKPGSDGNVLGADLNGVVSSTTTVFGAAANALVLDIEFGAMGFSQLGAGGLQPFGEFGKNVGTACGSLSGATQTGFVNAIGNSLNTAFHS